jgi:hypothetical protein
LNLNSPECEFELPRITKKQLRLNELEKQIKKKGVNLAYERLKFAGLILKSGLCWFRGSYYLFVDRLLPVDARIDMLEGALAELEELAAKGQLERPFEQNRESEEQSENG